jgi:hypothetical protein
VLGVAVGEGLPVSGFTGALGRGEYGKVGGLPVSGLMGAVVGLELGGLKTLGNFCCNDVIAAAALPEDGLAAGFAPKTLVKGFPKFIPDKPGTFTLNNPEGLLKLLELLEPLLPT